MAKTLLGEVESAPGALERESAHIKRELADAQSELAGSFYQNATACGQRRELGLRTSNSVSIDGKYSWEWRELQRKAERSADKHSDAARQLRAEARQLTRVAKKKTRTAKNEKRKETVKGAVSAIAKRLGLSR